MKAVHLKETSIQSFLLTVAAHLKLNNILLAIESERDVFLLRKRSYRLQTVKKCFKLLLHPILHVYTHKCGANIVERSRQFYNRISRLQRPRNENWHAFFSFCARSMATNPYLSQG